MSNLIWLLLLISFVAGSASLMRTFRAITATELRRRARKGDKNSKILYRAASHGEGLRYFLWFLLAITTSSLLVFLVSNYVFWVALLAAFMVVWFSFAWMPSGKPTKLGVRFAVLVTPAVNRALELLQPVNSRLAIWIKNYGHIHIHTGMYEKDDLLKLIAEQSRQHDNRISEQELEVVRGALTFADKKVRDVMTPRRMIKTVKSDEIISPHLLDELHASGYSRFPVIDASSKNEKFAGTLYFRDLAEQHSGGTVRGVMVDKVVYVNEGSSLSTVLNAAIKTHNHLFIVVNDFEEIVGVISLEDVMEQIIGKDIIDEFDEYEDLRAVASSQAQEDRNLHQNSHINTDVSQSDKTVVE